MLKSWASSSDVKIICSARPHEEFVKTFADARVKIQLHELTKGDIHKFLYSQLRNELMELGSEDMREDYVGLLDEMVNMSDGVFLWAHLVMRSILSGIAHGDNISTLRDRLRSAPRELNALFKKILNNVDPTLQGRSKNMLLLATNDPFYDNRIPAIAYSWLSDLQDAKFPFSVPMKPLPPEEIDRRLQLVTSQLSSLTKGLLEMQTTGFTETYHKYTVGFLHRTVKDFLRSELDWRIAGSGEDLLDADQPELYLRVCIALEKFSPRPKLEYAPFHWIWRHPEYVVAPHILDAFCEIINAANARIVAGRALNGEHSQITDTELPPSDHIGILSRVLAGGFQFGEKPKFYPNLGILYEKDASISPFRFYLWYNQVSYIMAKLQSATFLDEHRAQLPYFLLIKARILRPDVQFCKILFDLGVLPSDEICLRHRKSSAPLWLVFLRTFLYDFTYEPWHKKLKGGDFGANNWLILEEFLLRGADADVVFILRGPSTERPTTPNFSIGSVADDTLSPTLPTPPSLVNPALGVQTHAEVDIQSDVKPTVPGVTKQEEEPNFYLELGQLVDALEPPNAESLRRLLSKGSMTRFWAKTSGFVNKFALWKIPASSSIRDKYRPVKTEWLSTRWWTPISVVTQTSELAGDFEYEIC